MKINTTYKNIKSNMKNKSHKNMQVFCTDNYKTLLRENKAKISQIECIYRLAGSFLQICQIPRKFYFVDTDK